jgi:hypothetical protein
MKGSAAMACEEFQIKTCEDEEEQGYDDCTEEKDIGYEQCDQKEDQGYKECTQKVDQRYSKCTQTQDQGYKDCCSWVPCSWACKAYVWVSKIVCVVTTWFSNIICVASVWLSNVVCVASTWISHIVCVAHEWISNKVCILWQVTKYTFCNFWEGVKWAGGLMLNGLAFFTFLLFLIPGLGPLLRWAWDVILTVFWGILSLFDVVTCALGWCPTKKLRLVVIVMVGEGRTQMVDPAAVMLHVQNTINLYGSLADVDVIPLLGDDQWIIVSNTPAPGYLLDVHCKAGGFGEDLGLVGPGFDFQANVNAFSGTFRRLVGYGAPVIAFVVRTIEPDSDGCSLGPLSDYITIQTQPGLSDALPHEIGHACNLWHVSGATNLMNTDASYTQPGITLDKWQIVLLRTSRHVTYF